MNQTASAWNESFSNNDEGEQKSRRRALQENRARLDECATRKAEASALGLLIFRC
jgi:hypothetical protein